MTGTRDAPSYRILDADGLTSLLDGIASVRSRLGGRPRDWRVREVGDGNLNLVFIVDGLAGSICVKQALPYVRAAGPSWPMPPERAFFEHSYYRWVGPHVGAAVPAVYHYDPELYCLVMECLSPHIILRQGLIAGNRYPKVAGDVGAFIARACFATSDFALPFERKMQGIALFSRNTPLIRITVDLVFADPYVASPRNRHTSPQLDGLVADLRGDGPLKAAVCRFGRQFLNAPQALLHGDLHSGSVMVTAGDSRVIDPEFAFFGPIGFDLGAFFGNLLLSWYSQAGHVTADDDRCAYQEWILTQAEDFWQAFRDTFLALWSGTTAGDAFPPALFAADGNAAALQSARGAFLEEVFADMLGFAACKMIRRILGFAHVIDFDGIADPGRRAQCESGALAMARLVLTQPRQFSSMRDVLDAVPRQSR